MDDALGHSQRALTDVDHQQQLALRVHCDPDPRGRTFQALDSLGRADRAVLDRAEQGKELIELDLPHAHIVQEMTRKGPQLVGGLHQPLQHRVRVDLEHARRAPDAQALSQARDDMYDEVDGGALPMKDRPKALQEVAATGDAEQLPPGTTTGMAIGPEIAPADPAAIGTVWVRA